MRPVLYLEKRRQACAPMFVQAPVLGLEAVARALTRRSSVMQQEKSVQELDEKFFDRADAHIHLSNDQISGEVTKGMVSASMMYATARFNSWVSAGGWRNSEEMAAAKEETIEYFLNEYRKMLDENLNDYINNFQRYMEADNA